MTMIYSKTHYTSGKPQHLLIWNACKQYATE